MNDLPSQNCVQPPIASDGRLTFIRRCPVNEVALCGRVSDGSADRSRLGGGEVPTFTRIIVDANKDTSLSAQRSESQD